jgi:Microcystin-dependent protein
MFNIPNSSDASNVLQAQPDSRDFSAIIAAAFSGTGVVSGCAVSAQASPNMTVAVAAGQVAVAGAVAAVTGGNVTIVAANVTNPRFDLIVVNNTGVKSAVAGAPAAAPVFPDPAGQAVLAAVFVGANVSTITNAAITDKRLNAVTTPVVENTGVIKAFGGTVAPAGYLLCNGAAVSRSTYAALFSLISTLYGAGDGSTTFNVPDAVGRSLVGQGSHADVSTMGANDGLSAATRSPIHNSTSGIVLAGAPGVGSLSLPNHGHGVTDNGHAHSVYDPGHGHGVNDPGHNHGYPYDDGQDHNWQYTIKEEWHSASGGPHLIYPALTGVSINGSGTGVAIYGNTTGVSVGGITSAPGINGAPSTGSLAISGGVGPGGTRPADRVPFML